MSRLFISMEKYCSGFFRVIKVSWGFSKVSWGEITGGDNDYSKVSRGQQLVDENPKSPGYFKELTGNQHLAGCLFQ